MRENNLYTCVLAPCTAVCSPLVQLCARPLYGCVLAPCTAVCSPRPLCASGSGDDCVMLTTHTYMHTHTGAPPEPQALLRAIVHPALPTGIQVPQNLPTILCVY
jgi:hypothetical protein